MPGIIKVENIAQIETVEKLAWEIMPQFYDQFLPPEITLHFLNTFQTTKKIKEYIENGFEYFLLNKLGKDVGYLAIKLENKTLILSKLYILKEVRRKGIGSKAFDFVISKAHEYKAAQIELFVNRLNPSVQFYKHKGFKITEELITDFGNGHLVDDYKMTMNIKDKE